MPVTLQPQYNLLVREIEWEIVPACASTGLGLLPWSPLGGGWLTGKYTRDERPTGATRLGDDPERGVEAYDRRSRPQRTWDVIDAVEAVAERARRHAWPQVALAWLVDRPLVSSVILGARTLEQLQDNLGAAGLHLDRRGGGTARRGQRPAPADYPYGGPGRRAAQPGPGLSYAAGTSRIISVLASGSRNHSSGGTGSPIRLTSSSTSTPAAFSSAWIASMSCVCRPMPVCMLPDG